MPYFPGDYITSDRLALLKTTKFVSILDLKIPNALKLCFSENSLVSKIQRLEIQVSTNCKTLKS